MPGRDGETDMFSDKGIGFVVSDKVDGRDFPIIVAVPGDDIRDARFQFPNYGNSGGRRLTIGEAWTYLDGEAPEAIKGILRNAIRQVASQCAEAGDLDAASFYVAPLVPRLPDVEQQAAHLAWLGVLMERKADFEAATGYYRQAIQIEPSDSATWYFANNNLGYSLNQLKRYAEAEPFCRTAISVDATRYNAHKNLGVSLEGQSRLPEAIDSYVRATELAPGERRSLGHLKELLRRNPEVLNGHPDLHAKVLAAFNLAGIAVIGLN